ncbi:D-amino-acid oxidase [Aulographum hederae CBS 113979]|uniref:D-amino-acid oxidase n=1 Tax=Aulographum hederae CBS 113979 TaxID=1176131 RepID=A0A6G1H825_9PEZI|nr:D-amino-acid oxidase [Aulographum hederae CBS 113979]
MTEANIVVVGAGVIGLTTALLLSRNPKYSVTVVAKCMPGDYSIEYASPWAGANYLPVGREGSLLALFERNTWQELSDLATSVLEAGVHFQHNVLLNRQKDSSSATGDWTASLMKLDAWFKDVVPDFKILDKSDLPPTYDSGTSFTSVCINTAIYLPYLLGKSVRNGTIVRRATLSHISEAASLHHSGKPADLVINCTGLSSLKLGGVADAKLYPARGQTVLVANDPGVMTSTSGTDDGDDEACYIMHRAVGGGCILGGCLQKNNWESQPDPDLAVRIMKRCVDLCPDLTGGKGIEGLKVIRHSVGLRPMREGGPRVEKEKIDGVWVVHQYGHGGYGYQSSFGSAKYAVGLVEEALKEKAKL